MAPGEDHRNPLRTGGVIHKTMLLIREIDRTHVCLIDHKPSFTLPGTNMELDGMAPWKTMKSTTNMWLSTSYHHARDTVRPTAMVAAG